MAGLLVELVQCWMAWGGIDERNGPDPALLERGFRETPRPCREGASPRAIVAWEERYGYGLPDGLRAWLALSDGLFGPGPLIHPLAAIGPMIPFAQIRGMIVQPESWFELGNPHVETICIDLAYCLPNGGHPIFTSGDDSLASPPRIIARSFEEWFVQLLDHGGREYWFDPDFEDFGDPWQSYCRYAPLPPLSAKLKPFQDQVARMLEDGTLEREIAANLGLTQCELELICRHLQHGGGFQAAGRHGGRRD